MAHNLHGDIPPDHIKLAAELEEMEEFFDSEVKYTEPCIIAKAYVCLAFDWYEMGDDDKGSVLLEKADKVCPGYFGKQMYDHMSADELFNKLVKQLTANILSIVDSLAK